MHVVGSIAQSIELKNHDASERSAIMKRCRSDVASNENSIIADANVNDAYNDDRAAPEIKI